MRIDTDTDITVNDNNQIGTSGSPINAMLGPLANNGGFTETRALLPGSPAINAGDPDFAAPPAYDQRGAPYARVAGGRIDIGAFEVQSAVVIPELPGDYNLDESVDAADYVLWRHTFDNHVDDYSGADGSGNGNIGEEDYGVWTAHFGETLEGGGSAAGGEGASDSQAVLFSRSADLGSTPPRSATPTRYRFADFLWSSATNRESRTVTRASRVESAGAHDAALLAWLAALRGDDPARGDDVAGRLGGDNSTLDDPQESIFGSVDAAFDGLLGSTPALP